MLLQWLLLLCGIHKCSGTFAVVVADHTRLLALSYDNASMQELYLIERKLLIVIRDIH